MENETPTVAPSSVKFTDDETKEITEIRNGFDQATIAFGKFYLQKLDVERLEEELKREFVLLEKQNEEFFDKIVKKYGEGTYDPKTNLFTPKKK
jgi:predicted transcriptional regulator